MRYSLALLLWLACTSVLAQVQSIGYEALSAPDWIMHRQSDSLHTSLRPFNRGLEQQYFVALDSSYSVDSYTSGIEVFPTGGLQLGGQIADEQRPIGLSSIGIGAEYHHEDRLYLSANYTPVLSAPSENYRLLGDSLSIIPGAGWANSSGDFFLSHVVQGRFVWNAPKFFSLEAGQGKQFWGDGYRSLILSQNSAPFPYLRISTDVWKIKYTNLWAQMRDVTGATKWSDARKKYTSMHALSWQAHPKLNVTFYEMVVWQDRDSLSKRSLDLDYLNPIIFFRPVEFAQGSADNVLIGMSWKWKMSRNSHAYGQLMFDEFLLFELRRRSGWWANKFGIQIGMRNFNFLTEGLHTQNEINFVRPFTYTHGSVLQAFGHVNQGLAHPMGTNFLEWVNIWRLERENWYVSQKFIWGIYGRDIGDDNFGGNVFRSYRNPSFQYGNEVAQGLKSTFHWEEVTYGRRFSKKQDLWGFASAALRFERNDHIQRVDFMLNVGVRTSLFPSYRDF